MNGGIAKVIQGIQDIMNAVALMNEITGGGVTPANLDGSPEFDTAAGVGTALYTAANNAKTNLNTETLPMLMDLYQGGIEP
jgi:hypothetical protein